MVRAFSGGVKNGLEVDGPRREEKRREDSQRAIEPAEQKNFKGLNDIVLYTMQFWELIDMLRLMIE